MIGAQHRSKELFPDMGPAQQYVWYGLIFMGWQLESVQFVTVSWILIIPKMGPKSPSKIHGPRVKFRRRANKKPSGTDEIFRGTVCLLSFSSSESELDADASAASGSSWFWKTV